MMLSAGAMAAPAITVSRDIDKMEDVTLKDTPWFLFIKTTEYFSGQTLQLYQAGSYRYLCWKAAMKQKQRKNVSIFLRFLVGNRPRSSGKAWLLRALSSAKLTKISVFPNAMEGHFFVFLRFRSGAHHVLAIRDDVLDNVTLYLKQQHTSMVISHMVWSVPSYTWT